MISKLDQRRSMTTMVGDRGEVEAVRRFGLADGITRAPGRRNPDETSLQRLLNEDAKASAKPVESIRLFARDLRVLCDLVSRRLVGGVGPLAAPLSQDMG